MKRGDSGQVMLEEIIILILVVIPLIVLIAVVMKKLSLLYQMEDLLMKVPVL